MDLTVTRPRGDGCDGGGIAQIGNMVSLLESRGVLVAHTRGRFCAALAEGDRSREARTTGRGCLRRGLC